MFELFFDFLKVVSLFILLFLHDFIKKMDIVKKENQTIYTIKAPGKCLLTGGYLILHPNQKGLSVSVDAYTQAMIQIKLTQSSSSIIHIHSIDMNETWNYEVLENGTIKTFQYDLIIQLIIEKIL